MLLALGGLGNPLGWFLIIVAVANTLLSLYYYMRIVVYMTMRDQGQPVIRGSIGGLALVNLCALALFVLFLLGYPIKKTADRFSRGLFHPTASLSMAEGSVTSAVARTD